MKLAVTLFNPGLSGGEKVGVEARIESTSANLAGPIVSGGFWPELTKLATEEPFCVTV